MTRKPSGNNKKGLPKALQVELDPNDERQAHEPTLEEFVNEMHGDHTSAQPQDGLPTLTWLQDQFKTKSAVIRYLVSQGHSVKDISKHLGMRYQHVRNVAKSELKRGPNEDWRKPYLTDSDVPSAKDFQPKPPKD